MSEDIQESLEAYFPNIKIEVEYMTIKTYQIKITKKTNTITDIKKSVTFEYKWGDLWTFSSNIEQIKTIINILNYI